MKWEVSLSQPLPIAVYVLLIPIGQDRDCFVQQANHWSIIAANSC